MKTQKIHLKICGSIARSCKEKLRRCGSLLRGARKLSRCASIAAIVGAVIVGSLSASSAFAQDSIFDQAMGRKLIENTDSIARTLERSEMRNYYRELYSGDSSERLLKQILDQASGGFQGWKYRGVNPYTSPFLRQLEYQNNYRGLRR